MRDLLALIATGEFDDLGSIRLNGANFDGDEVAFDLVISPGPHAVDTTWRITCLGVASFRLTKAQSETLAVESEHVLLWESRFPSAQLIVREPIARASEAAGELLLRHRHEVGRRLSADDHLNNQVATESVLRTGSGQVASGPVPLMEAYRETLSTFGGSPHLLEGAKASDLAKTRRVLLLDDDFVVASEFTAARR